MHTREKKFKKRGDDDSSRFLLDLNHFIYSEEELNEMEKNKKRTLFEKITFLFKVFSFFAPLFRIFSNFLRKRSVKEKKIVHDHKTKDASDEVEDIYAFEDDEPDYAFEEQDNSLSVFSFLKSVFIGFIFLRFFGSIGRFVFYIISYPFRLFRRKRKEVEKKKRFFSAFFGKFKAHPIFYFVGFLVLISLPLKLFLYSYELKGRVLGVSETAIASVKDAGQSIQEMDFEKAGEDFVKARESFLTARGEIGEISKLLTILSLIPNKNIQLAGDADLILEAAELSTEIGSYLSSAMNTLSGETRSLKNIFDGFYENSQKASADFERLQEIIKKINPEGLPQEYRDKFLSIYSKSELLEGSMSEFADVLERLRIFLGFDMDKRYLLVFQNNTEMRASGGFIGSYAIVDFSCGEIKNMEIPGGGSYDTEAGLLDKIISPEPLHLVSPRWYFWDANWWPDWPTTARKLQYFLEKSNGPSVDGVISITPKFFEDILKTIGSIDMTDDYGVVIDADNFWSTVQAFAEQKHEKTNTPKKIIGDMMNKLVSELPQRLNKDVLINLGGAVINNLSEKHILFYFNDIFLQEKVMEYDWGGEMKKTSKDYLMVVNTNIAGGKSDKMMKENIEHNVSVSDDGSIIDELRITRTHTGEKRVEFTGVRNVNWLRVYVPRGSTLIEARGFDQPASEYFEEPGDDWIQDKDVLLGEGQAKIDVVSGTKIYDELDKTVFANWTMVDPGESIVVYLKYKLPFRLEGNKSKNWMDKIDDFFGQEEEENISSYSLLVQKQPGSFDSEFSSDLMLSSKYTNVWQYPLIDNISPIGWQVAGTLTQDKYWAVVLNIE